MFIINIDDDDDGCICITLLFKNENVEFEFSPESCQDNFEVGESGRFRLPQHDGINEFHWDESNLTFHLATYGTGFGGKMVFTVKNTPEIMQSWQTCLLKWKEALKNPLEEREEEEALKNLLDEFTLSNPLEEEKLGAYERKDVEKYFDSSNHKSFWAVASGVPKELRDNHHDRILYVVLNSSEPTCSSDKETIQSKFPFLYVSVHNMDGCDREYIP